MCLSPGDWANIASAIATTLATAVALGFGLYSIFKANSEAKSKANLAAARVSATLTAAHENLNSQMIVQYVFNDEDQEPDITKRYNEHFGLLRDYVVGGGPQIPSDLLLMLTALDEKTAHRIARALDLIEQVCREVREYSPRLTHNVVNETGTSLRSRKIDGWFNTLISANDLLDVAARECVKAANLGAPYPKGEELYGIVDDL